MTAMSLHKIFLMFLALCISCTAANAEDLTREKRADIERLLTMTGSLSLGKQMASAITANLAQNLKQTRPDIPDKVLELLPGEVMATFEENMGSLKDEMIPLYHRHFSAAEIKGLIGFYSTDLGQKAIRTMPVLLQESMLIGQRWGQSLSPKIRQRIGAELKQQGVKL